MGARVNHVYKIYAIGLHAGLKEINLIRLDIPNWNKNTSGHLDSKSVYPFRKIRIYL